MALVVQKYGGTSVANAERIKAVAERVANRRKAGDNLVVVLSARSGDTDRLLALGREISSNPDPREMDVLLATGEQMTIALLSMALKDMGFDAISMTGYQAGIITNRSYSRARINWIETLPIMEKIHEGKIVVVAGFQGYDDEGNITTLGRGGSDTTAVALAAALSADMCEIYTDVEGVFTTDPNVYSKARKLDKISYMEMLEMASMGAKVLHLRSVEFGMKYHVPIMVLSSFTDAPGTLVTKEDAEMEKVVVSGITYNKNEARITITNVPDAPGMAAKVFRAISNANVNLDLIVQGSGSIMGRTNISFTVPRTDYEKTFKIAEKVAQEMDAGQVHGNPHIAKISVIGLGMRSHPGVASKMFETLARENINLKMISTSEIKISCIIDEKYTELAVRVLHDAFQLDKAPHERIEIQEEK
ncbi:aspartate kinase [Desulforhabdus amnigena]|uniref:Aspartokinase n=1 Tax=Desulforhabdus amnigena TaxID=40218 RepID=A0A9W6FUI8_9BACT|nr:aspartate kinase [Desulforhabdus amnigena]NLJ27597.1 aspartate kinase [Deltaproteobacteria bacterium]GLI35122.1 aspartokinase [Desulforhabdus amnigena]